jgi:hypothetical protein
MEDFEVSSRDSTADLQEANLPPVDRGRGAWGFLAACFMIEALIWGNSDLTRLDKGTLCLLFARRIHILLWNLPGLLQYS